MSKTQYYFLLENKLFVVPSHASIHSFGLVKNKTSDNLHFAAQPKLGNSVCCLLVAVSDSFYHFGLHEKEIPIRN